jgi:UDP-glucuronate decarboxylase
MKTILISGCAGFIGQNLLSNLISKYKIIGIDNFYSGSIESIERYKKNENFKFIEADITNMPEIKGEIDIIYNLACPASPPIYQKDPLFTINTSYLGTKNLLELAKNKSSIFIQASTSEVYGDPEVNPQPEEYNGNVNTTGLRSCYDEGKRIAETLCYEYRKIYDIKTRIIRIFNTYGPGMEINDGRVISNFLVNIINKKELIVYGDGKQTRSFCYIDDLIRGLISASKFDFDFPINLGNNNEISLNKLVELLQKKYKDFKVRYSDPVEDDPKTRRPNIYKAKKFLKWEPKIDFEEGIEKTFNYFKNKIKNDK